MAKASSPFALGTFAVGNEEFPGLVVGDRTLNLSDVLRIPGSVLSLVQDWDAVLPRLEALAADSSRADWWHLADVSVRAPLRPRQIVQAGANYRTHVIDLAVQHAELGPGRTEEQVRTETAAMMDRRAAEGTPYLFLGLPGAVAGPYDDVVLPGYSEQHDWELELAAVIGRRAFRVDRESAADHVAGYTIVNDLTTRDLVFRRDMPEIGTDWLRAKNAPGFLPTGPWLVPSSFVDPGDLRLTLKLNDEVMQDESTKDMVFDVAALVSAASQVVELLPGDLVLSGSPAGNGMHHGRLLRPGDVMTATITGLGAQRTRCVAEET
ncbi:fumarylacetoacetate hydrolase family protein [Haloactinomyces albus]|uniref:2-keto-4-pentenoate hydratase/2-oxohepta-3-ene-1,7-dioic acid hydratase in catechol pathway n=1 Tax=Haloactinomyces albus TaxID=1352928 RepID=A0AAE4CSE2_9ACTN|nr:fumarylacetoacetate hydrolase family protein [Haloactinomyces albus]MDR7304603.1 2-keto-4-pentenoate hydratase/2-oxohepta-3-ene-1,7-dioic acid hydratase in catechol pathway [Haloactinomyces albus]